MALKIFGRIQFTCAASGWTVYHLWMQHGRNCPAAASIPTCGRDNKLKKLLQRIFFFNMSPTTHTDSLALEMSKQFRK